MKKLVGVLGWLGVALVVAAVGLRFGARPDWFWAPQWSQYLAMAGLVVTALYGLSQWRDIGRSFQSRNVKYGSIALGSVAIFLAVLTGINWIANRQNKRWDLTSGGQFELSDQTKKILTELKKPVKVKVYYSGAGGSEQYRDKLEEYEYQTKMITAEDIDTDTDPLRAQGDGVDTVPTIMVEYEGRKERATQADESNLTNALKKAIEGKTKKIYFVQGHNEHDLEDTSEKGYSGIINALKTDNFETAPLVLAQAGKVPDDATAVVIAGPKLDYLAAEVEALRVYLKKGGKVLLMLDPPAKPDDPQQTNLIAFAKEWGVDVGNNLVVDPVGQMFGTGPLTPIGTPKPHAITQGFKAITAFPMARSAAPIEGGANGRIASKVFETSPQSWAEADIKDLFATRRPQQNVDKGDLPGPISIIAAVSVPAPEAPEAASPDLPKPETRVVVTGDSDFLSNGFMNPQLGNSDLGLNIANYLAQQENLIAIRPKDPDNRSIAMSTAQKSTLTWLTLLIIPLLLVGNGVRAWWRRR